MHKLLKVLEFTASAILQRIGNGEKVSRVHLPFDEIRTQEALVPLTYGGKVTNSLRIRPEYLPFALTGVGLPINGTVGTVGLTISFPFANGDQVRIFPNTESPVVFTKVASATPGPQEFTGSTSSAQILSLIIAIKNYNFSGWVRVENANDPTRLSLTVRQPTDVGVTTATATQWSAPSAMGFTAGLFPDHNGQLYLNQATDEFHIWNSTEEAWQLVKPIISNDATFASPSASEVSSTLAVKTYVDSKSNAAAILTALASMSPSQIDQFRAIGATANFNLNPKQSP